MGFCDYLSFEKEYPEYGISRKTLCQTKSLYAGSAEFTITAEGKLVQHRYRYAVGAPATVIRLQDAKTGAVRQTISLPPPAGSGPMVVAGPGSTDGFSLAFSSDSKTLIGHFPAKSGPLLNLPKAKVDPAARITTIRIWDTATGKERRRLDLPEALGTGSMALTPDGRVLACENGDGTVSAWELASGKERIRLGKTGLVGSNPIVEVPTVGGFAKFGKGIVPRAVAPTVAFSPDGALAAIRSPTNSVRIWHVDTGVELGAFSHDGEITTLAFTPDSRRLVTGSTDTTLLVWDVARLRRPDPLPKTDLGARELGDLWDALRNDDAGKAFAAVRRLVASPQIAVPWLGDKLKPAMPVDQKDIERFVAQLGSEQFEERKRATEALADLGDVAVPHLEKVVGNPQSLEDRRRVETLLLRLTTGSLMPDHVRLVRAIEVLERAGTPDARRVLQALAKGAPQALGTREAQAAVARLR